jgi:hypothetical protein
MSTSLVLPISIPSYCLALQIGQLPLTDTDLYSGLCITSTFSRRSLAHSTIEGTHVQLEISSWHGNTASLLRSDSEHHKWKLFVWWFFGGIISKVNISICLKGRSDELWLFLLHFGYLCSRLWLWEIAQFLSRVLEREFCGFLPLV